MRSAASRPLAIVTGASSGIGRELALRAARDGFDLIVAADNDLDETMSQARGLGAQVEAVECDLATRGGVDKAVRAVADRPVAALLANAGHGLGRGFSLALRNELQDTGVTVTCLMPGVTDTEFFERADLMDTKVGTQDHKADPAEVAKIGFDAMMKGDADVIAALKNKLQVAMAGVMPKEVLAQQHRKMAEPGSAKDH